MCGIAGVLNLGQPGGIDERLLRTMSDALVHRGPDDASAYVDPRGRAGLAFRRLSIIDLAGGRQPMSNETGDVHLVFNGEIYNFRALRERLIARGHVFATRCDAEVIVHAYEEHGDECLRELSGMFAIAIWDERRGRLLLARDRFGKKPLCYAVAGDRLYFASEMKAILALPGVPREIDRQSLHRYLMFQYVPAPHAIFEGFGKLLPGHFVTLGAGQSIASVGAVNQAQRPFWQLPARARFEGSYDDAKERLGELLTQAVEKRLMADVPLGAFLSGGIDSSIVVGLMSKLGGSPPRTFSIGFEDARYNEAPHAAAVARHFGTEHHEQIVTPRAGEILDTLAHHYDEPFADSSAIPTWYVSRFARESVTVALTGDAGDECFLGYDRYRAVQWAQRAAAIPAPLRRTAAAAAEMLPHGRPKTLANRAWRFMRALPMSAAQQYLGWVAVFPPAMLREGYADEALAAIDFDEPAAWFEGLFDGPPRPCTPAGPGRADAAPAERAAWTDLHSYLPYDLLTKVDIASMAVSLECRCPFLDHELVEFAFSLPLEWRIGRLGGKHILKDWAAGLLPPGILQRGKQGFGVPIGEWFRRELRELLESRLLAGDSLALSLFRRPWIESLLAEHQSGRANHEHRLWALLMLELWRGRWAA